MSKNNCFTILQGHLVRQKWEARPEGIRAVVDYDFEMLETAIY
jgi:hypothetical protein